MSKIVRAEFLILVLFFVSRDLELGGSLRLARPQKAFPISVKFGM